MKINYEIVIIGGGLAGLTCALHLSQDFSSIALIEKNNYPHHKVCGEYVSNEVLGYLKNLVIDPFEHGAKKITQLQVTTQNGKEIHSKLELGGFSISRYSLDGIMAKKVSEKLPIIAETVIDVIYSEGFFKIRLNGKKTITAQHVIGAYGKRSAIDKALNRKFISKKTPWLAVKAHYEAVFPEELVALHHFKGGYCGLSNIENNRVNMCYLTHYNSFKPHKNITEFEKNVLSQNPYLKDFLANARPVFETPLTISQISFDKKNPVENHIFMVGDSAGLIHPLCGNGMAMAIHSAKILSDILIDGNKNNSSRSVLEKEYTMQWNKTFQRRIFAGRQIQHLFMNPNLLKPAFFAAAVCKPIIPFLINKTHGKPISIS